VTGDLLAAYACRAAALAAVAGSIPLALNHRWLAFALVLWMVPSLLLVGRLARRAHARTTSTQPRKDTTPA